MKRNLFPLICCELCNKKFRRITNTHLFKDHQITLEDYQLLFPDSPIDAPGLAKRRVQHLRNKTYIEVYGEEKARGLIEKRSIDAINQMDDEEQIIIRKEKCGYKISQRLKTVLPANLLSLSIRPTRITHRRLIHPQTTTRNPRCDLRLKTKSILLQLRTNLVNHG